MKEKEPLRVLCGTCKHRWHAAYLPMPLARIGELLKSLHCPNCASHKALFLDQSEDE